LEGGPEVVKILLEKGVNINAKGSTGETALMRASRREDPEVAKLLLEEGADINAKDFEGKTALIWAAWSGHPKVVKTLIVNGANVHAETKKGETALDLAKEGLDDTMRRFDQIARREGYVEIMALLKRAKHRP
jgi:ankyrin repeat protein